MKYCLVIFSLFVFNVACKNDKALPMEEEQLIRVLCDIHIVEAGIEHLNGTDKDSIATRLYNQIYDIHGVQQASVDTALFYLKKDPDAMEKIYSKVMDELGRMKLVDE